MTRRRWSGRMRAAVMHDDLFERLEHDHAPMSAAMREISVWFAREERGAGLPKDHPEHADLSALRDKLELLKELVIEHFGEEEELVFPILAELLPAAAESLGELARAHDAICGLAVRLGAVAHRAEPDPVTMRALFDRLEASYVEHAQREQAALRAIRGKLSLESLLELKQRLKAAI